MIISVLSSLVELTLTYCLSVLSALGCKLLPHVRVFNFLTSSLDVRACDSQGSSMLISLNKGSLSLKTETKTPVEKLRNYKPRNMMTKI